MLSSYYTLPSKRKYLAEACDLDVTLVRNAMTKNVYLELKKLLHFQDYKLNSCNKYDKLVKCVFC